VSPDDAPAELLEAFEAPLLLLDGAIVAQANAAARALLGQNIVGRYVLSVIPQPEAEHLLTTGGAGAIPLAGIGADERRWELAVRPAGRSGRLVRLEDRSLQHAAERMRTDFVANASHELRTPLAALIGYVETLQYASAPEDQPARERFLGIMAQEARRMQRLIDELMSLSRIEADRYVPPRAVVDLDGIVRTSIYELRDRQRVALRISGERCPVLGDRAQLAQLADNIISNALRYARPESIVRVELACDGPSASLRVIDEGEGIAPEHLPRLTERFYRVAASRSRALGGTGLGLAIVKHIVERHRGRLDIASTVGVGTTVTVRLPVSRNGNRSVTDPASIPDSAAA